jgi:hypothetical protein
MYSGGMMMPGRKFAQGNSKYRYSINGQEKESELNENITTAEFWEYDSRTVRRWNIDPFVKVWESSYLTFSGNPIRNSDILGNVSKSSNDWVQTKDGQMINDSRVTNQETADKYYEGGTYVAPGAGYTAASGEKIVLGKDGNFTKNGVAAHSPDQANVSQASVPLSITTLQTGDVKKERNFFQKFWNAFDPDIKAEGKLLAVGAEVNAGKYLSANAEIGVAKGNFDVEEIGGDARFGFVSGGLKIANAVDLKGNVEVIKLYANNLSANPVGNKLEYGAEFFNFSGVGSLNSKAGKVETENGIRLIHWDNNNGSQYFKQFSKTTVTPSIWEIKVKISFIKLRLSFDPDKFN